MVTGHDIQSARKKLRESQAQFGARLGVNQSTVHRWETEGPPGDAFTQRAISAALDDLPAQESAA